MLVKSNPLKSFKDYSMYLGKKTPKSLERIWVSSMIWVLFTSPVSASLTPLSISPTALEPHRSPQLVPQTCPICSTHGFCIWWCYVLDCSVPQSPAWPTFHPTDLRLNVISLKAFSVSLITFGPLISYSQHLYLSSEASRKNLSLYTYVAVPYFSVFSFIKLPHEK